LADNGSVVQTGDRPIETAALLHSLNLSGSRL
jgi:hypothetical protein